MQISRFLYLCFILLLLTSTAKSGTIHGFVREQSTREPVIMGNVWIKGTTMGTTTNMKGYYVLSSLPAGNYEILIRYIGFKTKSITKYIGPDDDITEDIYLEEEALKMEEVVVSAERDKRELDIKPSQITVSAPQLRSVPQVAEADLFRAVQMLPGVATLSDFSAGLYVRGGSADQNLILLDHIDVYNPNHMFGFFSTFNTDAIKSVELLKGGFPANYGGRMSSVLNVINKEGNRQEFKGVARLSVISGSATLEGPWSHGSWMLSGRRTYLDLAGKMVDFDLPYYFYDGHGKFNYDIDKNNQASFSFYIGNDILDWNKNKTSVNLSWGNKTFTTQWTHLFSSNLYSHFVFAGSRFDSDTEAEFEDIKFGIYNEVTDIGIKGGLTYTPSMKHSVDFGFDAKYVDFDLNYFSVEIPYNNSYNGSYIAAYVQDNYKLTPLLILQTGLRVDHYTDGGYTRLDPRISIKHIITDSYNVTFSYGKFHQFLNLVQMEGASFADMWFPVDDTFEPGEADHFIAGFEYDNKTNLSINIEGYYKNYHNIAEFKSQENRPGDTEYDNLKAIDNFYKGKGNAYGADIYIRNNIWGFEGWLGYSLCWTEKTIPEYNDGKSYYPTYDRRHTITAIQDYRLSKSWRLNVAFKYGSGQPYTGPVARVAKHDPAGDTYYTLIYGDLNEQRLPAYHRLDVGLFYTRTWLKLPWEFYFQAVNVYNRDNVWFRDFEIQDASKPIKINDFNMIPFVPTFGFSVNF